MKSILSFLIGAVISLTAVNLNALQLYCPADQWLPCGAEIWDLSLYGNAYYIKNGVQYSAGLANVQYNLNSCETGNIVRTWQIEDANWNIISCSQTIYVEGGNFSYTNIHWPESEILVTGCNTSIHPDDLPAEYRRPTWDYVSCSMVASSYKDQVFVFSNDCKKILRKWTVIDWCNYTPGGSKGIYTQSQVIKVSNMTQPVLACTKNATVTAERCDSSYVQTGNVAVEGVSCTGTFLITNDSPYADTDGPDASGTYPVGTTKFNYIVDYACGNQVVCESEVVVKLKGPTPYCIGTMNVALMPVDSNGDGFVDDGMVEIWAKDLDWGSYHDCNNKPLNFSFSSDITDMSKTFTCADVGYNTIQMWVTDYLGNQSYCVVNVSVQNNAANIPNCFPDIGARYLFSGQVLDQGSEPIENVLITAKDYSFDYDYQYEVVQTEEYIVIDSFYNQAGALLYKYQTVITSDTIAVDSTKQYNVHYLYTDEQGFFATNDIPMQKEYNISAYKSGSMELVNTLDMQVLLAYLDGAYTFTNPYTYLAADVNEDKVINAIDYQILRDLINEEEDEWPRERQWVFYGTDGIEAISSQPLNDNLQEALVVNDFSDKVSKLNLMGILKGDLTKFEDFNFKENEIIQTRNSEEIKVYPNPFSETLTISNPTEEEITIIIYSLDGKEVAAFKKSGKEILLDNLSSFSKGSYLYKIENAIEVKTGKIVKL